MQKGYDAGILPKKLYQVVSVMSDIGQGGATANLKTDMQNL